MSGSRVPQEIIDEYELSSIVCNNGYVYLEVNKGMYGLKQEGLLAHQLLEKQLKGHGYSHSKVDPGLWTMS